MEKEIEQLYRPIFLYIKKRINNELDVEDLTQEVFYKLSKSKYDQVNSIKNWVYSIARNSIIDYYRKKKYTTEKIEDVGFQEDSTTENAIIELSRCIEPFIEKLPQDYKEVIKLSEMENISQKEVAERLNMNYVTARSKIQRGRLLLKNLISDCCSVIQGGKGGIVDFRKNDSCDKNC